jgi:phage terminase large subunit-like protein
VDFGQVFDHIEELHGRYRIQAVAYDRWRAKYIEKRAADIGLTLLEWGQGFQSMTPAIEVFEDKVLNRLLIHEANPAMRWNVDCCQLKSDGAGNKKLLKPPVYQKSKHIDMAISAVMAVGASYLIEGHVDPYSNGVELTAL